jgi:hypothetical protein
MWCVAWFHENALLLIDGRSVAAAEDGASCAAGENQGGSGPRMTSPSSLV